MRFALGIPRRPCLPSRRATPTSRLVAISKSTASWIMRRTLARSAGHVSR
jgi:hypothetical protein